MAKKSLVKGKSGEREFCTELSKLIGINVLVRNLDQTRSGGRDLKVESNLANDQGLIKRLDEFSIEVKRYRNCKPSDVGQWWRQAARQASEIGKHPMLAYRLDRQSWKCMVHLGTCDQKEVHGCISMDIRLFAELLKHGYSVCATS